MAPGYPRDQTETCCFSISPDFFLGGEERDLKINEAKGFRPNSLVKCVQWLSENLVSWTSWQELSH